MASVFLRIPVHIQPTFWLLAAFIGWINSGNNIPNTLIWIGIITLSVLIHEYGHALTAVAFRQRAAIELLIYGGLTRRTGKGLKSWQEFIVVFNGPLAGSLFALGTYVLLHASQAHLNPLSVYALTVTWQVNLFWTILNLLPIYPMDGGQLLTISLQGFFGLKGLRTALLISTLLGLLASIFFFLISALLAGVLFLMLTFESYRSWRSSCAMTQTDQNPALQRQLHIAEMMIEEGASDEAMPLLVQVITISQKGLIHDSAAVLLAKLYYEQGRFQSAADLLKSIAEKLDGPGLEMLAVSALRCNDLETVEAYGSKAYQEYPSYRIAVVNARCQARLQRSTPAIGWLRSALRDGLPNIQEIISLPDFDSIRESSDWKLLLASVSKK